MDGRSIIPPPSHGYKAERNHIRPQLRTYLCWYLRTYLHVKTTVNQNPSNLDTLHSHKAILYCLTEFYYSSISSEQLVYALVREKLVRSSRDGHTQHHCSMFETYLVFPKTHLRKRFSTSTPIQGYQTNQNLTPHRIMTVSRTEIRESESTRGKNDASPKKQQRTKSTKKLNTKATRHLYAHPKASI